MLRFTTGNLLDTSAEALVNTVNEVGVMGKGIALMFRERFPASSGEYLAASRAGEVRVGHVLLTPSGELFPKWIIHFPTKRHWRNPSRIEWVQSGLRDLVRVVEEHQIQSIALPPLGCGNGGLAWADVKSLIESAFEDSPHVDVLVFEPTDAYQAAPKRRGVTRLTPARALVAELVRRYSILGLDCTVLEVQKLAYFLQRTVLRLGLPDPLDFRFTADKYGPYSDRLRHLLDGLDGSILHSERRLADARPNDLIWFDETKREMVEDYLASDAARKYAPALEATTQLIDGYESPLGLELLATVDWLLDQRGASPNVESVRGELARWPADDAAVTRKVSTFDARLVKLALDRLTRFDPVTSTP